MKRLILITLTPAIVITLLSQPLAPTKLTDQEIIFLINQRQHIESEISKLNTLMELSRKHFLDLQEKHHAFGCKLGASFKWEECGREDAKEKDKSKKGK